MIETSIIETLKFNKAGFYGVCATAGVGKSTFLCMLAAEYYLLGKKIFYYNIEDISIQKKFYNLIPVKDRVKGRMTIFNNYDSFRNGILGGNGAEIIIIDDYILSKSEIASFKLNTTNIITILSIQLSNNIHHTNIHSSRHSDVLDDYVFLLKRVDFNLFSTTDRILKLSDGSFKEINLNVNI